MAGETTHPNFFILLGLDPDAPWDAVKFETALKAKMSEWSRQSAGVGAKAIAAQKNREMIPDIRKVMEDQAQRDVEALAARKERASASKDRIAVLEQQLTLAEAKGYLEKGEFDRLVAEFKDVLSEREIHRRLKVEVRVPTGPDPKAAHKLDSSIVKAIEQRLAILSVPDLYQLFAMKPNTSAAELCRAADQLYHEMTTRQPKDAEVTAKSELAGYAKDIFQSPDKRKGYDESLRQQSLDALLKQLDDGMNRLTDKTLHVGQVQWFMGQAAKKGWSSEEALTKLLEHARQRKWYPEVPTLDLSLQQQRCGNCQTMNEKKRKNCSSCNMPLTIPCPNCGQMVPSDEAGCSNCGFPTGNAFWIDDVLAECEGLLNRGETTTADERLRTAERAWAPKKPDERAQKIHAYREKIQSFTQEQQRRIEQLRQMVDQRQFYAAQRYLATLPPQASDGVRSTRQHVSENIARVQTLVKQAQSPGLNGDRRVELCLQALHLCADCDEARALLRTLPPAAPGNLQAWASSSVVSLSWDASTSRGASYKVVRKSGARPASINDGTLLAVVTGHIYDDAQPENGVPLFYAVFSAYDEVVSAQATVLAHPVLLARDVSNVSSIIDNQLVDLRWSVPEHVHEIIVVRKEGSPPTSAGDGTRLQLTDRSRLVDRAVQNERRYYYGIYCLYRDYDQRMVSSRGVIKDATPETPPTVVTHLDIQSERRSQGYEVRLSWTPPSKGQVMVLKSPREPALKVGESIDSGKVSNYGTVLQGRANSLTDTLNGLGFVYYTPVVIFQNAAYIGEPHRHVCVEDVSGLEVENLGNALRLQWMWPTNCQETLVCFDFERWPSPGQATTNVLRVSRAEYERYGRYDIRGASGSDYYIVVAAVVRQDNEEIVAAGTRIQARLATKVVLTYEIKQARGLFGPKQRTLHLYARTPGKLPSLLLVSRQGRLPVSKTEGNILFRQPGPFFLEDHLVIPLPDTATPPKTFAKLYLEDDRYYNEVIIHHPGEDKLRLS